MGLIAYFQHQLGELPFGWEGAVDGNGDAIYAYYATDDGNPILELPKEAAEKELLLKKTTPDSPWRDNAVRFLFTAKGKAVDVPPVKEQAPAPPSAVDATTAYLPPGWEAKIDPDSGKTFYVDHN